MKRPITVYAPNLARRKDRRASILEQFNNRSEFDFHLVDAIEMKNGPWALWQTFYRIVEKEEERESDFFVFCEDDHVFTSNYTADFLLDRIEEANNLGVEILSGGMAVVKHPVQVSPHLFWVSAFNGMQFTVIYKRIYKSILSCKTSAGYVTDIHLSHIAKNKYVIYPFISVQKEFGYSDVTNINNEEGRVTRFFNHTQTLLEKLNKTRAFYERLPHSVIQDIKNTDTANCYIPTYIINLKQREDRLHYIKAQFLGRKEYHVHVIEACENENGAVGLWNSICKIIKDAQSKDEDYVLICEDDHHFTPDYDSGRFFHQVMIAGAMGAQILNGGVGGFGNLIPLGNGLNWCDMFWSTQFILVYRNAYEIILNAEFGMNDVADEKLSALLTNKMVITPFISEQADFGYSDVTQSNNRYSMVQYLFDKSKRRLDDYKYAVGKTINGINRFNCIPYNHKLEYLRTSKCPSLHLGSGVRLIESWLNTDVEPYYGVDFLDVAQVLPFPAGSFRYVYAEHLVEYLSFTELSKMLCECYRVLYPNGVLRLVFYSIEHLIEANENHKKNSKLLAYAQWCFRNIPQEDIALLTAEDKPYSVMLSNLVRQMEGANVYDFHSMEVMLMNAGFRNVHICKPNESVHPALSCIEGHKSYKPIEIYNFETLVVEASK